MKPKRRKDGLFEIKFSVLGKRYSVYGRTPEDVLQKEIEKRGEIWDMLEFPDRSSTFAHYAQRWINELRDSVKSATIRSYITIVKRICDCRIDDLRKHFWRTQITGDIAANHQGTATPTEMCKIQSHHY